MARHPYPALEDLPEALKSEMRKRIAPGRGNVWHMLCWSPGTAERFIPYSEAMRHENEIPEKLRELMILRVGHLCKAPYEIHHHRRIAKTVGLTDAEIAAAVGGSATGFDPSQRFVLEVVEELVAHQRLSQPTFDKAVATYGVRTTTDMVLMVGFYVMACMFLNSFEIDIEPPASQG